MTLRLIFSFLRVVLALSLVTTLLQACSFKTAVQPSVLVIMVENMGFGSFSCGDVSGADLESGFQAFCEESVRFTHTYTPSTLSQVSIASILTAQYPFQHGVRHNGAQALSSKIETVAEVALSHRFHTSFFTGGPPIWRKSGFNQGMETFDDHIKISMDRLYRPAPEVFDLFLNWQEAEAPKGHFLSFLYLADLQFTDVPTTNEIGELRESSYRSQVAEVAESLDGLVKELKRRKVWDNTDVFLVGLNGYPPEGRDDEAAATNLFSERTRVTLMIKPSRNKRDGPFNWKIDTGVSLVDVGATLYDLVGAPKAPTRLAPEVISLRSALQGPEPDWSEERLIVSESAWAPWRGLGGTRGAIRKGSFLQIQDERPLLFDTWTDSLEISPLPMTDRRFDVLRSELSSFLGQVPYEPWVPVDRATVEKLDLARDLWRNRPLDVETKNRLKSLSRRFTKDEQLLGWRAIWSLRQQDWTELKNVAGQPDQHPLWSYVASKNLAAASKSAKDAKIESPPNDPCLGFLKLPLANWSGWHLPKECTVEGLADLLAWVAEAKDTMVESGEGAKGMELFMRFYAAKSLFAKIAEHNYMGGLVWDTPLASMQGPATIDLLLALPELKKFKAVVDRRMSQAPARE